MRYFPLYLLLLVNFAVDCKSFEITQDSVQGKELKIDSTHTISRNLKGNFILTGEDTEERKWNSIISKLKAAMQKKSIHLPQKDVKAIRSMSEEAKITLIDALVFEGLLGAAVLVYILAHP
ncbi:putative RxLR effector [Phytophthora palmivora]|uniref:RxLR effector n=1 Tax=Phytophthora palmivora TaxID=4796 RepID=A0A2P4X1I1_9STRA|nr:putative RxLR effector [Phytophthora palmivora]